MNNKDLGRFVLYCVVGVLVVWGGIVLVFALGGD